MTDCTGGKPAGDHVLVTAVLSGREGVNAFSHYAVLEEMCVVS